MRTTHCVIHKHGKPGAKVFIGNLAAMSPLSVACTTSPVQGAVSPDGKNYYGHCNGGVECFSINQSNGNLTFFAQVLGASNIAGIVVSPDGNHVYATLYSFPSGVYQFSRNQSTGALTALSPTSVPGASSCTDVMMSPDGNHVYAIGYSGGIVHTYSRNAGTGQLTYLSATTSGTTLYYACVSPDGLNLYLAGGYNVATIGMRHFRIDNSTGGMTFQANYNTGGYSNRPVVSPDGKNLYLCDKDLGRVYQYSIDGSGNLTALSPAYLTSYIGWDIDISSDGKNVFVAVGNTLAYFSRNTTSGLLTYVGALGTGTAPKGVNVTPDGSYVYTANSTGLSVSQFTRS